jgi:cytidyltransferase-like protein
MAAEDGAPPADWSAAERPIVMVSGCYDLLHSGHAAFFKEASEQGNLYVSVGNDANIRELKHHDPMFPEGERVYMVRAIRHVKWAAVCAGMGMLDWEADLGARRL